MEREEARRLIQSQIDHLTASLIYQDSGSSYSPRELDQISGRIEVLRRELAAL